DLARSPLFPYTTLFRSEGKQQNPSLAKTEKSRLSEPISVRPDKTAEGTSKLYAPSVPKKPSVRKELNEIKAARKKEAESKGKERSEEHTSELQSRFDLV